VSATPRDRVLFWLLLGLWAFNATDLLLTRRAIALGRAQEANGVMKVLMHAGSLPAYGFKIGFVTLGVVLLWRLRSHHAVLLAATLLAASFAVVVSYEALWVWSLMR
jgi:hypothetical protein